MIEPLSLAAALYVASHLRPENQRDLDAMLGPVNPEWYAMNRYTAQGMAWTLIGTGGAVAMAGIETERPGVGTWWLVGTPALEKHTLTVVKFGRNVVKSLLTTGAYHRIQAHCLADWPQACRMAEAIGLQREGTLRAAGIGKEDFAVYAVTHG